MNDIRRTMLWVVFGLSLVMLWDQWQVYNGRKTTFFPSATPVVAQAGGAAPASSVPNAVPGAIPSVATSADNKAATAVFAPQAEPAFKHEQIVAQTDVIKVTFDTEGGSVVRTEFLKEVDKFDKSRNFVLLDDSKDRVYVAQSGLISTSGGIALPTHKTLMTLAPGGANQEERQRARWRRSSVRFPSGPSGTSAFNCAATTMKSSGSPVNCSDPTPQTN